jgi:uncharacterized lipoprotein YehR (DUF1307 family)
MNKTVMISLVLVLLYTGCNKENDSTKEESKNTNHIEVNTSDDKPLKLPF